MTPVLIVITAVKVCLLIMPASLVVLGVRRLLLSRSANAWLYGAAIVFGAVTTLGLLPWMVEMATPPTLFITLSALCPPLWYAILLISGLGRKNPYAVSEMGAVGHMTEPLVLTDPVGLPLPVFRRAQQGGAPGFVRLEGRRNEDPDPSSGTGDVRDVEAPRGLREVVFEMRGRLGVPSRPAPGPRLIAPPVFEAEDLPFLDRSAPA